MARVKLLPVTLIMALVPIWGFAGDIRRFTDSQGILHISNVENLKTPECSNLQESAPDSPLGKLPIASSVSDPVFQEEILKPILVSSKPTPSKEGVQDQSSSVEKLFENVYEAAKKLREGDPSPGKPVNGEFATGIAQLAQPAVNGSIISYKDQKGVIHIANRGAREGKSLLKVASTPAPQEKYFQPGPDPSVIRPASWLATASDSEAVPGASALPISVEDPIRHYTDQQGVLRISNNERPEKASNPGPPVRLARNGAGLHAGISFGQKKISVSQDWQGICHIFNNAAELVRDRGSPLAFLGKLSPDLEAAIVEAARMYRLPVPLILALIKNESNFVAQAVSPKGAMGMMQLMPGTARSMGVQDPFSFRENINGGCRYFRSLLNYFQGSVPLALAAYNAGPQRVISAGHQIPPIKETQGFVAQVMALYYILDKLSALNL